MIRAFESSIGDLRVLRHDKSVLHPLRKLDHLKHIPEYLMPAGLQTGEDPTKVGCLFFHSSFSVVVIILLFYRDNFFLYSLGVSMVVRDDVGLFNRRRAKNGFDIFQRL